MKDFFFNLRLYYFFYSIFIGLTLNYCLQFPLYQKPQIQVANASAIGTDLGANILSINYTGEIPSDAEIRPFHFVISNSDVTILSTNTSKPNLIRLELDRPIYDEPEIIDELSLLDGDVFSWVRSRIEIINLPVQCKVENDFEGGDGTNQNPYQICNLKDIQSIEKDAASLSAHYILINHIETSSTKNENDGKGFAPIGSSTPFTGTINGQGHSIIGLHIDRPNASSVALISECQSCELANLALTNFRFVGGIVVGSLVGNHSGTIKNCYSASGDIRPNLVDGLRIGGLVGLNRGTIASSYTSTDILLQGSSTLANTALGGLTGINVGNIQSSYFSGSIRGTGSIGGLVGINGETTIPGVIRKSYSVGRVLSYTPNNTQIGGIVGEKINSFNQVENNFWDIEQITQITNDSGIGLSSKQMKGCGATNTEGGNPLKGFDGDCFVDANGNEQYENNENVAYSGWGSSIWYLGGRSDYPILSLAGANADLSFDIFSRPKQMLRIGAGLLHPKFSGSDMKESITENFQIQTDPNGGISLPGNISTLWSSTHPDILSVDENNWRILYSPPSTATDVTITVTLMLVSEILEKKFVFTVQPSE